MPYFSIETNIKIESAVNTELMKKASRFLADLMSKPEQAIMVTVKPDMPYIFGGSEDPAAFVQVKALNLDKTRCPEFSRKVGEFIEAEINVPINRVFIEFTDIDGRTFGYNGDTLGH